MDLPGEERKGPRHRPRPDLIVSRQQWEPASAGFFHGLTESLKKAMAKIITSTHNSQTFMGSEDGKTIIGESADVSGNLDRVQRMRQADINNATLGRCIASIPMLAIKQWGDQFGIELREVIADDALLDRCIADYSKFKVHGGYIS